MVILTHGPNPQNDPQGIKLQSISTQIAHCIRTKIKMRSFFLKKNPSNDDLVKELLKVGVTLRGLKGLWFSARRGDHGAQRRLLEILSEAPIAYGYVEELAKKYQHIEKAPKTGKSKPNTKKKPTPWQRAAATVGPEGATVFSGGLPTLGKKR